MKKLFLTIFLLISFNASANDLGIIDPNIVGQQKVTVTCIDPVERVDGAALAIGEVVNRKFYVESNGADGYKYAAENMSECKQVFDMTKVNDGAYVYAVTALDAQGRESDFSPETVSVIVKRLLNLNTPTSVSGSLS